MMSGLIHKGFFKEIFRQLMVAGIVSAGILMLGNLTSILSRMMQNVVLNIPSASDMASSMKIYVYVVGLIMPLSAFGWLNRRARSDFYHSIPVSRTQMFFSTFLAMALWMFIGLIAYSVVNALLNLLFGTPFNYFLYLCVVINMLIAAVEVLAAVSLACAVSGTRFVNIVASVVILFMPRLLLTVLAGFITYLDDRLVPGAMCFLFDPSFNIIAVPYSFKFITGMAVDYANGWAMLYTSAYTSLLVVLGWLAFKRRSSETAGQPTSSKVVQALIRISLGIPLLLIISFILLLEEDPGLGIILGPILLVISFVVYCLYELISTKSALKMAKAMPLFLVCVAVAVLYIFLPKLIVGIENSVKLAPEDIEGYQIVEEETGDYFLDSMFNDYLVMNGIDEMRLPDYRFSDERSCRIIAEAFTRTGGRPVTVRIDRKGALSITRRVYFTGLEVTELEDLRLENKQYAEDILKFPNGINCYSCSNLSRRDAAELASIFEKEYNALPKETRELISQDAYMYDGLGPTLSVSGCLWAKNYRNTYTLTAFTPETLKAYLEINNRNNGQAVLNRLREIEDWTKTGGKEMEFTISMSGGVNYTFTSWSMVYDGYNGYDEDTVVDGRTPAETDKEYCEIISILARGVLTDDITDYVFVSVSGGDINIGNLLSGNFDAIDSVSAAIKLSPEDEARIIELIQKIDPYWNLEVEYGEYF